MQKVADLGPRISGVQRQEYRSGANGCQVKRDRLRRFLNLHRDAIPGFDVPLQQQMSELAGELHQFGIGPVSLTRHIKQLA